MLGFLGQFMEQIAEEIRYGRSWCWKLRSTAESLDCALFAVEIPRWLRGPLGHILGGAEATFFLPRFVRADRDVADLSKLLQGNDSLKDDIRRVRKKDYWYQISSDPHDYETFLERYSRPSVSSAHGCFAIAYDYDFLKKGSPQSRSEWRLLKVMQADRWVAGCLLKISGRLAQSMDVGVRDGDPELVREGAGTAANWFFVEYANERGCSKASFMWSPPFLRNGVLRFKAKYRPDYSPVPSGNQGILLIPTFARAVTRHLLKEQPFLEILGDQLEATAFVDRPEHVSGVREGLKKETRNLRGVAGLKIVVMAGDGRESNLIYRDPGPDRC